MAVADAESPVALTFAGRVREKIGFLGLFGALAAYTLTTLDGGEIASQIVSSAMLLIAALYLSVSFGQRLTVKLPTICLLLMTCYGAAQTIWSPQKIAYDGWARVLFWSAATAICVVSSQICRDSKVAVRLRWLFVVFGSAICVLDLLEQASHTNKYFWLIQSRYSTVNGPFAYWNNFAQFVELLVPVTLWLGVSGRKPALLYLVLSGLQIGAVVASGSRAGSALVIAELVAVMVIAYFRNRNWTFLYAACSALLLSVLFAYAAGFNRLSHKLEQRDQLAVRRDINLSSLAMIRERPLTGWGLGTYVPVYRMFARYDDGTYVNRAHNDWFEWSAEGGLLFAGFMAAVFLWSIRPAIRSVWGIGLIAVCLHAFVDYPFARLGVCGWYFALLGMLAAIHAAERSTTDQTAGRSAARPWQTRSFASAS